MPDEGMGEMIEVEVERVRDDPNANLESGLRVHAWSAFPSA